MTQISIIGTRGCGKTTYLAALALCPHRNEYPGLEVTPIGDDAEELVGMAENIVREGKALAGNRKEEERKEYEFDIRIPKLTETIRLSVKDSAGELFDDFVFDRRYWEPEVDGLVNELCQPEVTGWIIMTDWIKELDTKIYQPALKNLLAELNVSENYNKKDKDIPTKRIAVMMSKSERGEAWTGRLDPGNDLFKLRLPETYKELQKKIHNPKRIDFFACSSFGVLGDKNPRPNRLISSDNDMREYAYLREGNEWRPYGLFSPIYWLVKGSRYWDESM
ncbi:hypothetical protein [Okeania sp. KiyG1]|uniref:TRAFAC clade GTPase domain-containing protein n=1 Tax=Okeania sp. KiyG1 TaxID=2720165 RepID=UPI0019214D49|nr:hypothetical protein [Okeania sp. KiyG1]GGA03377.1 hypothetical protein CYANOKiyG1_15540 [Okeania sp. KiyG1]